MHGRHAVLQPRWQSNVGVAHAQGRGQLFGDEPVKCAAIDPPDDFGDDPPVVDGVVGQRLAGGVDGRCFFHGTGHLAPIGPVARWQGLWCLRKAAPVGQDVPDGHGLFAILGELGPIRGHGIVPGNLSPLFKHVEAGGS